ncbi:MAG: TetR/AcrR family transcriptional regulator [Ilumatobacteraceae bacterium]
MTTSVATTGSADLAPADLPPAEVTPKRGRPRDVRCDHAILQATIDILIEGGAANLSIDGVAARAGVGKATIYRRWSSKEALVLDAINTEESIIPTPDTGTLRGDLEQYYDGVIERFRDNEGSDVLPHLIEAACYDPEVRLSLDSYLSGRQKPLRVVLQRAIQRGEITSGTDVTVLIDVLVGPTFYRRLLTGGEIDRTFVHKILDIVLGGR